MSNQYVSEMNYHYQFSCDRRNLKSVRDFVASVLRDENFSENEIPAVVLAVDEICANLIVHSHQSDPNDVIEIWLKVTLETVICEIIDQDSMFYDFSAHKNPDIHQIVREGKNGGVGLMLVKCLVDKVEVERHGTQSIWRLTKESPRPVFNS
ncbi:ATP-binding protein [Cytophagaceae bacterium DM2B3-1]|uniref:ATP-binding protein n=2 Tax=Xanthocytophaga TaxID=3078918 RepID=A0ABT7CFB7_9BACT|nr:ATP-binding protein [Xanthocytophaga flavus]MDJ1471663.1 ATP-binding protein [Xanthocytophaga flavus]MDJ1491690.1 ATP-binding protein [Xanthocytophaga flavus]